MLETMTTQDRYHADFEQIESSLEAPPWLTALRRAGLSRFADLGFPAARDEEWQPTTQESMFNYVRMSDGGITRLDDVRPESTVLCDLAAGVLAGSAVNFAAFRDHGRVRQLMARTVTGMAALAVADEPRSPPTRVTRVRPERATRRWWWGRPAAKKIPPRRGTSRRSTSASWRAW